MREEEEPLGSKLQMVNKNHRENKEQLKKMGTNYGRRFIAIFGHQQVHFNRFWNKKMTLSASIGVGLQ